ncbi:hypothetical protein AGMMS50249_7670 [candidate division SR1 bacterium]|nr:hypothetical protein AGMMS50249_7670 [candidate division SR1 bacterium]
MRLSVVFGTRGNEASLPHLERIFTCLQAQTFQPFSVICVVDTAVIPSTMKELGKGLDIQWIASLRSYGQSSNASHVRNLGLKAVKTELVQLFDDDNAFDENYLARAVRHYDNLKKELNTEVVICGTVKNPKDGSARDWGFSHFNFRESRPVINIQRPGETIAQIQMFSGNGLLGNSQLFKSVLYDEQIARIAEDLDFTLSLYERGTRLFVLDDLPVQHYERDKSRLEMARIGSSAQAHQKARNRFIFLQKHGKWRNYIQFFICGLPGCLIWLSVKTIIWGGKHRRQIISGLFSGAREGFKILRHKN